MTFDLIRVIQILIQFCLSYILYFHAYFINLLHLYPTYVAKLKEMRCGQRLLHIKIGKMGPKIAEQLSFLLFALGFTLNYMNQAQGGHRSSVVSPEFPALNLKADASSG